MNGTCPPNKAEAYKASSCGYIDLNRKQTLLILQNSTSIIKKYFKSNKQQG